MTHIQLVRCDPPEEISGRLPRWLPPVVPASLLVGELRLAKITDQKIDWSLAETKHDGPRTISRTAAYDGAENSSVISGPTRVSSILVGCASEQLS